jgi:hypothetical protein
MDSDTDDGVTLVELSTDIAESRLAELEKRVSKLNRRGKRYGFEPLRVETGERFVRKAKVVRFNHFTGVERTITVRVRMIGVKVAGEVPVMPGWTFEGVGRMAPGGYMVVAPEASGEEIERALERPNACDVCNKKRARSKVILMRSPDGDMVQMGGECLKPYIGGMTADSFSSWAESLTSDVLFEDLGFEDEEYGEGYGGGRIDQYDFAEVIPLAIRCAEDAGGYRGSRYEVSTSDCVKSTHQDLQSKEERYRRPAREFYESAQDRFGQKAREILEWLISRPEPGDNFQDNVIKSWGIEEDSMNAWTEGKYMNFAVWLPSVFETMTGKTTFRPPEPEVDESVNEYVGQVGDRIEVMLTTRRTLVRETQYGWTTLFSMTDPEGRSFGWWASGEPVAGSLLGSIYDLWDDGLSLEEKVDRVNEIVSSRFDHPVEILVGDDASIFVKLKGTVKSHKEFKGVKSTYLSRVAVVKPKKKRAKK